MNDVAVLEIRSIRSRTDRALAALAVATPAAYLLLLGLRPYPGDVALKTAMCVLLAALAWRAREKLLTAALLCSAAGDAFLGLDGDRLFAPGLASFLITHILYAAIFVRRARTRRAPSTAVRKALMALILLFAACFSILLWPKLGALAAPVILYVIAIIAMALLALRLAPWTAPLGAILFVASDSLLALGKFLWQAPWLSPAVWVTYACAQLFIVHALLANPPAPGSDRASRTHE